MSASLVGSEMCIRDRGTLSAPIRLALTTATPTSPTAALATTLVTALAPVSYTHLTLPTICSV
eukprot:14510126-Alexandrium_andersonii.AAC.1